MSEETRILRFQSGQKLNDDRDPLCLSRLDFYMTKIRNESIRWEKPSQVPNLIIKPIFFCQEKNIPVYVMWKGDEILLSFHQVARHDENKAFRHGTMPLMRIASSGHTSSHFRQPKQTSSLTISSTPLWTLRQKTGQISTQAPQPLQWSRISIEGFIIISDFACPPHAGDVEF